MVYTKEEVKKLIKDKINQYLSRADYYSKISEIETAEKFISPIFSALGWDVDGKKGRFDEVIREDNIAGKRVDYSFRIESLTKFTLEAKSTSQDIDKKEFIEQAIKYAYNKRCYWAILTNFKHLKLFILDRESRSAFRNIDLTDLSKFDENFEDLFLLSRNSFEKKEIDLKAEREGRKKPTVQVDKELFDDFNKWRLLLSKDIKKCYRGDYTTFQVDDIVQKILDRLIFIRKTEDIPIEEPQLKPILDQKHRNTCNLLKEVFHRYRELYDSELFLEHECDKIGIRNEILLEVIEGLYLPKGRIAEYDFNTIEDDVLGQIYEKYLGYVLKTSETRARGEEEIAHRHEQGIYYTPTSITNYIVKNTIGHILKNSNVEINNIRVLDPACGSGSFLIKAFNFINNYYTKNGDDIQIKLDSVDTNIPLSKKSEIIRNDLYGVDLDSRAVEIAKLNLLLKLANKSLRKIKDKKEIMPLLEKNVKVGNSLIDNSSIDKDKAFEWHSKFGFKFDVVIGNPPYISYYSRKAEYLGEKEREYFFKQYAVVDNPRARINSIQLFFERAYNLCKDGGYIGFIVDRTLLEQKTNETLRNFLLKNTRIIKIAPELKEIFEEQKVDVVVIVVKKEKMYDEKTKKFKKNIIDWVSNYNIDEKEVITKINQRDFEKKKRKEFMCDSLGELDKKFIKDSKPLTEVCILKSGANVGGHTDKFLFNKKRNQKCHPVLKGSRNIPRKFALRWSDKDKGCYILYDHKYNLEINAKLEKKKRKKGVKINLVKLGLGEKDKRYEKPKIIIRQSADRIIATYDEEKYYALYGLFILNQKDRNFDLKYVLGLLNSDLFSYYSLKKKIILTGHKKQPQIRSAGLKELRIRKCNNQEPFIKLVDELLSLNKKLIRLGEKETSDIKRIKEEIDIKVKKLNDVVYKLYEITDKEKEIIEKSLT